MTEQEWTREHDWIIAQEIEGWEYTRADASAPEYGVSPRIKILERTPSYNLDIGAGIRAAEKLCQERHMAWIVGGGGCQPGGTAAIWPLNQKPSSSEGATPAEALAKELWHFAQELAYDRGR